MLRRQYHSPPPDPRICRTARKVGQNGQHGGLARRLAAHAGILLQVPEHLVRGSGAIVELGVPPPKGLSNAFTQVRASVLREPRLDQSLLAPPKSKQGGRIRREPVLLQLVPRRRRERFLTGFGIHELKLVDDRLEIRHRQRLKSGLRRRETEQRLLILKGQTIGQFL